MNWKDELKKQAEGFYIGLGDLQSETSFMDGVNYAIDKSKPYIGSLLKKRDDALKTLAMLGLQSRCYEEYIDFRLAVDNALEIIDSPEGGSE